MSAQTHPSIRALARLLAERIASDLLQDAAKVVVTEANVREGSLPTNRDSHTRDEQTILESDTSCKFLDP